MLGIALCIVTAAAFIIPNYILVSRMPHELERSIVFAIILLVSWAGIELVVVLYLRSKRRLKSVEAGVH